MDNPQAAPPDPRALKPADGVILAALTGLLFSAYLLTASLTFISDDELYIFDTVESLARHHSTMLSETADLNWPVASQVEPAMPVLAAPIYALANRFRGIGNVHATLLFNPLVTALTAALLFLYVRQLGFGRATALTSALAFGLTTIAWPYTKTFFREPLATLTLFAAGYGLLRWRDALRQKQRGAFVWLAAALACGLLGMFTKESALVGLPMLLLIVLVQNVSFSRADWLRTAVIALVGLALAGAGLWAFAAFFDPGRFDFAGRLAQMWGNLNLMRYGLAGFLFSPGKSLFIYSPVLLLALGAPFVADRSRRLDAVWPLALLAAFVIVYSLVRGELWWGGANWGPRYMVPLTPFLMISAAPLVDAALFRRPWLGRAALAALLALGAAVQAGGLAVRMADYDRVLGGAKLGGPWTLALWTPLYSPVLGHWRMMSRQPPDFAWVLAPAGGPAWNVLLLGGGLALLFGVLAVAGLILPVRRRLMIGVVLGGALVLGAVTWFSLRAIYYDQRYNGNDEALHQLNAALAKDTAAAPDPVIFLNNRAYFNFMLNYYKGNTLWYTLELNPNELLAPGEQPPARSTDPAALVNPHAMDVVNWFSQPHKTIFLINEHGPFTPESPRPLEWWMSENYFYVGVQEFSPIVRLVEFSAARAPAPADVPAHAVHYQLDQSMALIGWDARPDGTSVRPGGILNLSTQWQALAAPGGDYKIGTYLITQQGAVALQVDSIPVNGFWPTGAWLPGDIIRHNVAFVLPKDLAPGFYEVWTLMYSTADNSRLSVQDASGTAIRDHIVLFTVEVTR